MKSEDDVSSAGEEIAYDPDLDFHQSNVHPALEGKFVPIALPPPPCALFPYFVQYAHGTEMAQPDGSAPGLWPSPPDYLPAWQPPNGSPSTNAASHADLVFDIQGLLASANEETSDPRDPLKQDDALVAMENVANFIKNMTGSSGKSNTVLHPSTFQMPSEPKENGLLTTPKMEREESDISCNSESITRASTSESRTPELQGKETSGESTGICHPLVVSEGASEASVATAPPNSQEDENNYNSALYWNNQHYTQSLYDHQMSFMHFLKPEDTQPHPLAGDLSTLMWNPHQFPMAHPAATYPVPNDTTVPFQAIHYACDYQMPMQSFPGSHDYNGLFFPHKDESDESKKRNEACLSRRPFLQHEKYFPESAKDILREWLMNHISYPYPNKNDKDELCMRTGLTMKQLNNWFTNTRKRHWRKHRFGSRNMQFQQDANHMHQMAFEGGILPVMETQMFGQSLEDTSYTNKSLSDENLHTDVSPPFKRLRF